MVTNRTKKGCLLTEITLNHEYYLANLMALNKFLGIPLKTSKELCKHKIGEKVVLNPPILIKPILDLFALYDILDEYGVVVSITIPSK